MPARQRSPSELRNMFGQNLKDLAREYASVSELSRQLGINRTQFNRYLSGESFPRPDVLERICNFFNTDARILLEPAANLKKGFDPLGSDALKEFITPGIANIPQESFPSGFYRFSRRSFVNNEQFVAGLVRVNREEGATFIRGFEAREAMRQQGLPVDAKTREFRGLVMLNEDGVAALISRRGAMTSSFNYLNRASSFQNNFWVGYVTRTTRESPTGTRISRVVFEHIGDDLSLALDCARSAGLVSADDLIPYHHRLLQPDQAFR
jgi:transcriptional regulator with XRE-family HTH domain